MADRTQTSGGRREYGLEGSRPEAGGPTAPGTAPGGTDPVRVDAQVSDPGPGTGGYGGDPVTGTRGDVGERTSSRAAHAGTLPPESPESPEGAAGPGTGTADRPGTGTGAAATGRDARPDGGKLNDVRQRWTEAQGKFVDDPQGAVREADALASEVADAVVSEIEARRHALRAAWDEGEGTDTESLRVALRDYRSFVEHLISEVR